MSGHAAIGVGLVRPDLLGTYGDGGNALVLAERLRRRAIPADIVAVHAGEAVPPSVKVLVLGGGEDAAQRALMRDTAVLASVAAAADRGVPVLAVCAALQVLGRHFDDGDGHRTEGVGLLDVETDRLAERAVGETVVDPRPAGATPTGLDLGAAPLTGFENHGGRTTRLAGCPPLGFVRTGVGNGDGTDGAVCGRVVATYLHGPVLARNPVLADRLLEWALDEELAPLTLGSVDRLRVERLAAAPGERAGPGRSWPRPAAWRARRG